MTKRLIILCCLFAITVFGIVVYFVKAKNQLQTKPTQVIHFLDSTPSNLEVYAAQPINVTLNFNSDLTSNSNIVVVSTDGKNWKEGHVLIEDNNTALKVNLKQGMPNGQYNISYTACFEVGQCESGSLVFSIDDTKQSAYRDLRGKKQVVVIMKDLKFVNDKIIISPSTKVVWENEEDVGHFVNTQTHPEHTYYPLQNSKELTKGQSFSTIFETAGQYNYHCSAHVPQNMFGSIIVEN